MYEELGQEWCNPKNLSLKSSGYITKGTPYGLMVLCRVYNEMVMEEKHPGIVKSFTKRYKPLTYEDLNIASVG